MEDTPGRDRKYASTSHVQNKDPHKTLKYEQTSSSYITDSSLTLQILESPWPRAELAARKIVLVLAGGLQK